MSATMRSTMMWVFVALGFFEQFGECFLCPVAFLDRVDFLLGFDDVLGKFEDLLQELQAGQEALLVALLDLFQPLAQRGELGVAEVLAEAGDELDLDLLALLRRIGVFEDVLRAPAASMTSVSTSSRTDSTWTFSLMSSTVFAPRACQSSLPLPLGGLTDS